MASMRLPILIQLDILLENGHIFVLHTNTWSILLCSLRIPRILTVSLHICWALFACICIIDLSDICIGVIILLNLLRNPRAPHKAFIIRIFLILVILQINIVFILILSIKVMHGVMHLWCNIIGWSILAILKCPWWCWSIGLSYYVLVVSVLDVLVIGCLLSSSLLHGELLAVLVCSYVWSV